MGIARGGSIIRRVFFLWVPSPHGSSAAPAIRLSFRREAFRSTLRLPSAAPQLPPRGNHRDIPSALGFRPQAATPSRVHFFGRDGGTQPLSGSAPAETSSPALPPRATVPPRPRVLRRTSLH